MSNPIKKVFVYTELQVAIPFEHVPWKDVNPILLQVKGLIRKTWLSGIGSNSVGGLYEFDSLENAQYFAWEIFPHEAKNMGASFITKLFDGDITEEASRDMHSPHYN
jgi:hypothetical protein